MTKEEIIKKLRDMAKYPTVTLPRDTEALRNAADLLEQAEQEPVAYGTWDTMIGYGSRMMMVRLDKGQDGCTVPLYTSPPPRQPLTDWEINSIAQNNHPLDGIRTFARAIEAKLRSKNESKN